MMIADQLFDIIRGEMRSTHFLHTQSFVFKYLLTVSCFTKD